ncbi:MAG: enoyl-CoA hydratase/isomerase family protein [Alphaproteobacteria bacterium]|nr:enoyl-CoA hydratase/isomerase family protein [Alphaproteobacteria bacterium]MCW5744312.1 enoyl-CoA hydratase/isomerase family protein [Alphaproteobacteria bacterium]
MPTFAPIPYAGGLILSTRRPPVMTVILNSAETRNAFTREGALGLATALRAAEADPEIGAVVITGSGGNFCSGADLSDLTAANEYVPWAGEGGPLHRRLAKPSIAAIEGYASAEGLGLALLCDIRIVDETATFGVFARRLGVTGDGTAGRLPGVVGIGQAMDILLTGRAIGCDRAMAIGLATRKTANGMTRALAERIAQDIASFAPMSIAADRQTAYAADDGDVDGALRLEVETSQVVFHEEGRPRVSELIDVARPTSRLVVA